MKFQGLVQNANGHSRTKFNSIIGKKKNLKFFTLEFCGPLRQSIGHPFEIEKSMRSAFKQL